MRILLVGKNGQVGYELERSLQGLGEITAVERDRMELTDLDQVRGVIRAVKPDLLINAAAYTNVEKAEQEPDLAMLINGHAPAVMAEELKKIGGILIHYSTDYVFDGMKLSPYDEDDLPCPINAYGKSKLFADSSIETADIPHLVLRTSWVYGGRGRNFLTTVLKIAREEKKLKIVSDQIGAPTWCRTIAQVTSNIISAAGADAKQREWWQARSGLYHMTSQGETTWYQFAEELLKQVDLCNSVELLPIPSTDYRSAARRPENSVLDCTKLSKTFSQQLPHWKAALEMCMS